MSFREFITDRWHRRQRAREFERYQNIQPPANPPRRYIDKLVKNLLDHRKARIAQKELSMIGAAAVPSLADAMNDSRFHQAEWPEFCLVPAPLEAALELLVPHSAEHVLALALPLVGAPSEAVRKTAALQLASLGSVETIPALARLLQDSDGHVRSYVRNGIARALCEGRAGAEFRQRVYDLLLAQCDQDWGTAANDAPRTVVALDAERAAADFASERWLSRANPNVDRVLQACNDARIPLPETLTRPLLENALSLAVGDRCHTHRRIAAAALESLGLQPGERARPLLEAALDHEQQAIQETAARGLARLAGLDDPVARVLECVNDVGCKGLSHPQRVVYCAFLFDAEVCNGGIMQFFGNSSGDHAVETLDALRELAHPEAERALESAIQQIGPLAIEPDQEMRLAAFEGRYDQLRAALCPLEEEYYRTQHLLRKKMLLYATEHAEHFRDSA